MISLENPLLIVHFHLEKACPAVYGGKKRGRRPRLFLSYQYSFLIGGAGRTIPCLPESGLSLRLRPAFPPPLTGLFSGLGVIDLDVEGIVDHVPGFDDIGKDAAADHLGREVSDGGSLGGAAVDLLAGGFRGELI